ncbi:hypothetical protein F2Q68_00043417 [Brassica cretica]|uniref:Uncharacterized protein n=1 Tax=Brassica cretica TaxID=69181 RepID=A0A8S9LRH5_BRACR|nr:hypothetical protein F2Q68_00043417 [Brassica cretica]
MKESRAPRMLGLRPRMWLLSSGLEGQKGKSFSFGDNDVLQMSLFQSGQMKESRAPRMLGLRPRMWLLSSGLEGQKV